MRLSSSSADPNSAGRRYSGKPNMVVLMKAAGVTGAQLAQQVDVFQSTVSNWRTGKSSVPGAVIAYLELLAKVRALLP